MAPHRPVTNCPYVTACRPITSRTLTLPPIAAALEQPQSAGRVCVARRLGRSGTLSQCGSVTHTAHLVANEALLIDPGHLNYLKGHFKFTQIQPIKVQNDISLGLHMLPTEQLSVLVWQALLMQSTACIYERTIQVFNSVYLILNGIMFAAGPLELQGSAKYVRC